MCVFLQSLCLRVGLLSHRHTDVLVGIDEQVAKAIELLYAFTSQV